MFLNLFIKFRNHFTQKICRLTCRWSSATIYNNTYDRTYNEQQLFYTIYVENISIVFCTGSVLQHLKISIPRASIEGERMRPRPRILLQKL